MDRAVQGSAGGSLRRAADRTHPPAPRRDGDPDRGGRRRPGADRACTTSRRSGSSSWPTSPGSIRARSCRSSTTCGAARRRTGCGSSPTACRATTRACRRSRSCGRAPSGWSARPTTCSGSRSRATATCAGSTCRPTTRASRCARTSTCPTTPPARPGAGVRPMERTHTPLQRPDDRARAPDAGLIAV